MANDLLTHGRNWLPRVIKNCMVLDTSFYDGIEGTIKIPRYNLDLVWYFTNPKFSWSWYQLELANDSGSMFCSRIPHQDVKSSYDLISVFLTGFLTLRWIGSDDMCVMTTPSNWFQKWMRRIAKRHSQSSRVHLPSINFVELVDWDFLTHKERAWETP